MFADVSGLVGGFGKDWFDVRIWDHNGLALSGADGEGRSIYKMLGAGNRGIDYFSRGILEIDEEAPLFDEGERARHGLCHDPRLLAAAKS